MKFIINFYKELDTLNLILFWGIIIVIVLLLIFSIIVLNKNKKLKKMLISTNNTKINPQVDNESNDIPVINNTITPMITKEEPITTPNEEATPIIKETLEPKVSEEKDFVAEEHVMEYNKELFSVPNIEKVTIPKETELKQISNSEPTIPNAPYQKNVLRGLSLNQTSPIGIVKKENDIQKNLNNAQELQSVLHTESNHNQLDKKEIETKYYESNNQTNQEKYLNEVSKKLNEATNLNDIDRTAYELKQEEDAIISYKELMDKKDSIKIMEEEEAVISIEELMNIKRQKEKIYNITKEEENNTFIDELKHFRHDL